jgi:hypothetical protein
MAYIVARPSGNSTYAILSMCVDMDICDIAKANHAGGYADQHGYDCILLEKAVTGIPHKMLKYLLLAWALDRGYDWILMMDADALFTNSSITLSARLADFQPTPQTSLIATREARPVETLACSQQWCFLPQEQQLVHGTLLPHLYQQQVELHKVSRKGSHGSAGTTFLVAGRE